MQKGLELLGKIISFAIILSILGSVGIISVSAKESDWVIENGTLLRYNGTNTSITIPDGVKNIATDFRFSENKEKFKSITIPKGVIQIDFMAFFGFSSLTKVNFPDTLIKIDDYAFTGCPISNLILPKNLEYIGALAFAENKKLKTVSIPAKVSSMGVEVFRGCSALKTIDVDTQNQYYNSEDGVLYSGVTLVEFPDAKGGSFTVPDGIACIESYAFNGADKLKKIYIANSVENIKNDAIRECKALTAVELPTDCQIGKGNFYNCISLEKFNVRPIASGEFLRIRSIDGALYTYDGLALLNLPGAWGGSVTIPENVYAIGPRSFSGNDKITEIKLPESVEYINEGAFLGCLNLQKVNIPNKVTTIEPSVFADCLSIEEISIPNGVTVIRANAFSGCASLKGISIPEKVTSIDNGAFNGCNSLKTVRIPPNVKNIALSTPGGDDSTTLMSYKPFAFNNCISLANITVDASNKNYSSIKGVLYNKSGTELLASPSGKVGTIVIPSSVKKIREFAFENCTAITSVTIPSGIKEIKVDTFSNNESLKSLYIPKSVKSIHAFGITSYSNTLTVYGEKGSYIEKRAKDENFQFKIYTGNLPSPNKTAYPVISELKINNTKYRRKFPSYTIDGEIYIKAEDIGCVLNGTKSQFSIRNETLFEEGEYGFVSAWKLASTFRILIKGDGYQEKGNELKDFGIVKKIALPTPTRLWIAYSAASIGEMGENYAYRIGGLEYYRLKDFAEKLNFTYQFDEKNNILIINV